ncbi:MAG: hypothetical protein ACD_13C00045G0005 [uncultured bacterium]|nr:MAG: hypothetical protein ACD_13C00045G0005 [uncultured bacterium]
MKKRKIYLIGFVFIALILVLRFTVLQKRDTRLLYTVKDNTFVETVKVSGTYNKTASDTQKAVSYAAYQNAVSALATARQNKQSADAAMWAKRQTVLNTENGINYKNDNTTNPATKEDYTELEKESIDSALTQAEKDFRAAELKYKEADIAISAAAAQVNVAKIDYNDTFLNEPLLTVNVNEIYVPKISVGQPATVVFDAMKDTTLTGRVESIDPVGTITAGVVTFEVKIAIDDIPTGIRPNMTAVATIELINKENTITVPRSAIIDKDDKTFVKTVDGKNETLTEVQLGEKGYVNVEIVSGLNTGAVILAQPNI